MSTINDEITRIKEAKDNLKASIQSKGVAVGEDKIDKYYLYVDSIEQGGDVTVTNLNVSANGTYTAGEGEAYSPVVVNVPTSANLTSLSATSNQTYTPSAPYDGYNSVTVNVQPNLTTLNATQNQTYTPSPQYDGYSSVTVAVPQVVPNLDTLSVTDNGEYTPTAPVDGYDKVIVDVQPNLDTLSVTSNNTYRPGTGYDGFSEVTVNVPQSAASLTTLTVNSNNTYRPGTGYDGFSEVTVAVPQTAANLTTLNATSNTTYTPSAPYDGYNSVTVNVQPNLTTLTATSNTTYTPTSPYQGFSSVTVNVPAQAQENYITAYILLSYNTMFGSEFNNTRANNNEYFINRNQTGITAVYIDGVLQNPVPSVYYPTDNRLHEVKVVFTANTNLIATQLFGITEPVIAIDFTHFTGRSIGNYVLMSEGGYYRPLMVTPSNVTSTPLCNGDSIDHYFANTGAELPSGLYWTYYGRTFLNINNTAEADMEGNIVWDKETNALVRFTGENYIVPEGITNMDMTCDWIKYITLPSTLETFKGWGWDSTKYYFTGDPTNLTIDSSGSDLSYGYVLVPSIWEQEYIDLFEAAGFNNAAGVVTPVSGVEMEIAWNGTDKYIKLRKHDDWQDYINRIHRVILTNPNGAGGQPEVISIFPVRRQDALYLPTFLLPSTGTYYLSFEFFNPTDPDNSERISHFLDGADESWEPAESVTSINIYDLHGNMGNWFIANYPNIKTVQIQNDINIISDSFCYNCDALESVYIYSSTVPTLEGYDHFGLGDGHSRASAITVYVPDPEVYRQDASWADLESRDIIKFETI